MVAIERKGKFTASENFKLLVGGKKGEYFGDTAKTYIKEKACEHLTGQSKTHFDTVATSWGIMHEYQAIQEYQRRQFVEVENFGGENPKFFTCPDLEEFAGGSPDFLVHGLTKILGEVKCPYNSNIHLDNLLINSQSEFKDERKEYYSQIQFNIFCTGSDIGHFVSYDPRFLDRKKHIKIIEIKKDEEHINLLLERLKVAIDNLKELIS